MSTCGLQDGFTQGTSVFETAFRTMTSAMTGQSDTGTPVYPPAMVMAGPVFGLGLVAQVWGTMIGSLHGAAAAASHVPAIDAPLKMPRFFWNAEDEEAGAFGMAVVTPFSILAAATKTVYADMEHAAKDMVEVGETVLSGMAGDADTLARAMETAGTVGLAGAAGAQMAGEPAEAAIMPEDFVRPAAIDKPDRPDDLKLISGVGPRLEERLNGLGIWTFAQVAAMTPEQVAWVDDYLSFKGRIERDGWIPQAAALARGDSDVSMNQSGTAPV